MVLEGVVSVGGGGTFLRTPRSVNALLPPYTHFPSHSEIISPETWVASVQFPSLWGSVGRPPELLAFSGQVRLSGTALSVTTCLHGSGFQNDLAGVLMATPMTYGSSQAKE